jgi:hypothetical protein
MENLNDLIAFSFSKQDVIKLLSYEQEVRRNNIIQEFYDVNYLSGNKNDETVENYVQKIVLYHFNYKPTDDNLYQYNLFPSLWKHDNDVKNSVFYIKHNYIKEIQLNINDLAPNVNLLEYNTAKPGTLHDHFSNIKPTIIFSGSMT